MSRIPLLVDLAERTVAEPWHRLEDRGGDDPISSFRGVVRSDYESQLACWFVESLVDPRRFVDSRSTLLYADIFAEVLEAARLDSEWQVLDPSTAEAVTSRLARVLDTVVRRMRETRAHRRLDRKLKERLLDLAGREPRCWICGSRFGPRAVDEFVGARRKEQTIAPFLDVLKSRGLEVADFQVEVDHVIPASRGGGEDENLRLSCGWCNRHKGSNILVADVGSAPILASRNGLGLTSLPRPFWTVRLLSIVARCEHPAGCILTTREAELTVAPRNRNGAMNPANMVVTCSEHDPIGRIRLQTPTVVRSLWRGAAVST